MKVVRPEEDSRPLPGGSTARPRKEALLTIDDGLGNAAALGVEELAGPFAHLRTDPKGMVQAVVLFRGAHERIFALA